MATFLDQDGVLVVKLPAPALDFIASQKIRAGLLDRAAGAPQLVLDLSALGYLDHFGFELLLEAIRCCPGATRIAGLGANIHHVFVCEQLDRVIPFDPDVRTAVAALRGAAEPIAV